MDTNNSEKEPLENDDQPQSLIKRVYLFGRTHWLPLLCALIIVIITVVAAPVVYSIPKSGKNDTRTDFLWNITGITIISKQKDFNDTQPTLGIVSALIFDYYANLYLVDKTYNRILRFSNGKIDLFFGSKDGSSGLDSNSLNSPNDLYTNGPPQFYIADTLNHRIVSVPSGGGNGTVVFGTGTSGSDNTHLDRPMSVTMDGNNVLYIADYGNDRIVAFDTSSKSVQGIYLKRDSSIPNQERSTYVVTPISIRFDSTNSSLVIGQEMGYNVVRWGIGSPSWTLIAGSAASELTGTSRTLFNKVCDVTIDQNGNTYVADCYNQRIQFYKGDMSKGKTIAGVIQASGNNSYIFNQPAAICLDQNLNLVVADTLNYRIQQFKAL